MQTKLIWCIYNLNKGHKSQTLRKKIQNIDDEDGILK